MVPTESFRDLEIFQRAVREGSFTGAARSLGMTQPAVSLAIARLERQLGTTLFDRQSSGKRQGFVTRTGEVLAAHAGRAIAEMDEATDAIAAMEGRRPVRIGLPPIITHHYFPDGLDPLANACGTHPVEILSYGSERMRTELERHGIDVGMIASTGASLGLPRVRGWKVGSFPFFVAPTKVSRLADRGPSASMSLRPSLSVPSSGCSFRWRGPGAGYSACEGCRRGPCVGAGGEQPLGKARNPRRALCRSWRGRGRHLEGGVRRYGPRALPQQGIVPGKSR